MNYKIQRLELDKYFVCFIAISEKLEVIGKCSFNIKKNKNLIYQDTLIEDGYINDTIYKELFKKRQRYVDINFPNYNIEAYCTDKTVKFFLRENFQICNRLHDKKLFCKRINNSFEEEEEVFNDFSFFSSKELHELALK
tara:strand:- start:73 stop:489 length:417 start_codon:yes stop_codon:yes gene_type:complete